MDAAKMAESAMLGASKYWTWRTKFLNDWNEKINKQTLRAVWMGMPPQLKEVIRLQDPEAYAKIDAQMKQLFDEANAAGGSGGIHG